MKQIYVNGSSLSCGGSLEPHTEAYKLYINKLGVHKWEDSKEVSYGNQLGVLLGIDVINESKQGGGLDRLIRKTYEYINSKTNEELEETLFLFDIPIQPARFEVYSKQYKDWFVVSVAYRESIETPHTLTISTKDGDIDSKISFSRDYINGQLNLEFEDLKKHNDLLSSFVEEYHDYQKEAERMLRELTFFYCYLDKRKIHYIRDITEGFFAGSFMFDARNDKDFFDKLRIFDDSNPNVINMETIWTLSREKKWRIKDETDIQDDHLGYFGNKKYAHYLYNLLTTSEL
jgi:hypothetical protein